jgi:hypothetical protein
VLWLASHAADVHFVSREGTKLLKLVEATNADRPIPLVRFVALKRHLAGHTFHRFQIGRGNGLHVDVCRHVGE